MAPQPPPAALWGRVLLHNKILQPAQWEQCCELYAQAAGKSTMEAILVEKGFLKPAHVEVIGKKVAELWAKAISSYNATAGDKLGALPKPAPGSAQAAAAPAGKPAAKPAPVKRAAGEVDPLMSGVADGEVKRASEFDWVENADEAENKQPRADIESIDLSEPSSSESAPAKINLGPPASAMRGVAHQENAIDIVEESSGKKIYLGPPPTPSSTKTRRDADSIDVVGGNDAEDPQAAQARIAKKILHNAPAVPPDASGARSRQQDGISLDEGKAG